MVVTYSKNEIVCDPVEKGLTGQIGFLLQALALSNLTTCQISKASSIKSTPKELTLRKLLQNNEDNNIRR